MRFKIGDKVKYLPFSPSELQMDIGVIAAFGSRGMYWVVIVGADDQWLLPSDRLKVISEEEYLKLVLEA